MPEVKIDKLTTENNQVFFPGKAVLSDRAAEAFEKRKASAEAETSQPEKKAADADASGKKGK